MKKNNLICLLLLVLAAMNYSCTSTRLVDEWKNPTIDTLFVSKILIVGMTSNLEARKKFEKQLKKEYEAKGIEAVMSLDLFDPSFTTEKKSPEELKAIEFAINGAFSVMKSGDKLGIISYHSLEDRLVKQMFKQYTTPITQANKFSLHSVVKEAEGFLYTKKPIVPSSEEIAHNPRSRSAKLRIIQKK